MDRDSNQCSSKINPNNFSSLGQGLRCGVGTGARSDSSEETQSPQRGDSSSQGVLQPPQFTDFAFPYQMLSTSAYMFMCVQSAAAQRGLQNPEPLESVTGEKGSWKSSHSRLDGALSSWDSGRSPSPWWGGDGIISRVHSTPEPSVTPWFQ